MTPAKKLTDYIRALLSWSPHLPDGAALIYQTSYTDIKKLTVGEARQAVQEIERMEDDLFYGQESEKSLKEAHSLLDSLGIPSAVGAQCDNDDCNCQIVHRIHTLNDGLRQQLASAKKQCEIVAVVGDGYATLLREIRELLGIEEGVDFIESVKAFQQQLVAERAAREAAENERDAALKSAAERSMGLTIGNGLMVWGSFEAIHRAQCVLLIDSSHPQENEDVRRRFHRELTKAERQLAAERAAKVAAEKRCNQLAEQLTQSLVNYQEKVKELVATEQANQQLTARLREAEAGAAVMRIACEAWYSWCQRKEGADPLEAIMVDGQCDICCGETHQDDCEVVAVVNAVKTTAGRDLLAELDGLRAKVAELEAERDRLQRTFKCVTDDALRALSGAGIPTPALGYEAEWECLQFDIRRVIKQRNEWHDAHDNKVDELACATRERDAHKDRLAYVEQQLDALASERDDLIRELATFRERCDERDERIQSLEEKLLAAAIEPRPGGLDERLVPLVECLDRQLAGSRADDLPFPIGSEFVLTRFVRAALAALRELGQRPAVGECNTASLEDALADYENATKDAIPQIINDVRKRQQLAAESRTRIL